MSRWHALLALVATTGCFEATYTEGYRITYGQGRWARSSSVHVNSALVGEKSEGREALERDGIFSFQELLYLPFPTHGKQITMTEWGAKRKRLLVICLKPTDEGMKKVSAWRSDERTRPLVLSTDRGDFSVAFFETGDTPNFLSANVPYGPDDIRAVFGEVKERRLPDYIVARCVGAKGVLKLHKGRRYGSTGERDVDIFQRRPKLPKGTSAGYFKQLPIDLRAVGEFRLQSGAAVRRKVYVRYDTWNWRLHLLGPSTW